MKLKEKWMLFFVLCTSLGFCQNSTKNDSIAKHLSDVKESKAKITGLTDLASAYADASEFEKSKKAAKEAVGLSLKLKDEVGEMAARYELGRTEYLDVKYPAAIESYLSSLKLALKLKDKAHEATSLSAIAMVYYALSDFNKGMDYFKESSLKSKDSSQIASNDAYLGGIYYNLGKYDSAMIFYERSKAIYKEINANSSVVMCEQNIASIYSRLGQVDKAVAVLQGSLENALKAGVAEDIAYAYFSLGYVYSEHKLYPKAILNFDKSLIEFIKLNDVTYISNCHYGLSDAYYAIGDSKNALEHYRTYITIKDSTLNIEQAKEITRKELLFQMDKQQLADSLKQEQKNRETEILNNEKVKQQRIYTYAGIGGFVLMFALAIVLLKSNRNKQKANEAIAEEKSKVELQKDIIEEKQREIIDSINYAKRIQRAQLPTETYIEKNLKRLMKK